MALFSTPKCPSCIWKLAGGAFQQIRGNKKMVKVPTVTVRLLKDVPKYGPAGTLIPVAKGRMRSIWYPQKVADYVHYTELKKIPRGEAPQRDFFFLADAVTGGKKKQKATVSLLSPTQTIAILEALLPPSLQFSSATISPTDHSLHGSVSTVDIANAIKMVSSANGEEGARVVITPDQIELIGVDGDKIKMIGEYQFEIKMKGTNDFVRRRATVQRQEIH